MPCVARILDISVYWVVRRTKTETANRLITRLDDCATHNLLLVRHLHNSVELRQLIEKQHALVGERDLAGPGARSAADESRQRG
jgi:hypothetical protein